MQDSFPIPSCFSSGEKYFSDDPISSAATKSGQNVVISLYRTKIGGHCRLITITWCRNLLLHGLSISVDAATNSDNNNGCKVELRPWYFWRKHGTKRLHVAGEPLDVFWDLRSASFSGEPEPRCDYYIAIVSGEEVVLLIGDLKKEAYRRTGSRPAFMDATLIAKKEHVFGKKRFSTRAKLHENGKLFEISVECICSSSGSTMNMDPEMVIKIDGQIAIDVKHLQWKFRGNQSITINKERFEVYWDVHDWLFSPGLRHALFIFKPNGSIGSGSGSGTTTTTTTSSSSSLSSLFSSIEGGGDCSGGGLASDFCLFLYAWRLE